MQLGQKIFKFSEEAAQFSEPGPGVTRALGTPEHQRLLSKLTEWMHQAGLSVDIDAAGNLVGKTPVTPHRKTLIIGSHQDTVKQGGKYDGMLGILLPLVVLDSLKNQFDQLHVNIELIAFSDEEGARFASTLVGSSAIAGNFKAEILDATDKTGTTLAEALITLGGDPSKIDSVARDPEKTSGFLEVHIEQGPILESLHLPVGVVTAITGIERHHLVIMGKANHAGTTPMHLRQDALVAASYVVQMVNDICGKTEDLVGVVGELNVTPNAVNVIPSKVELTIELRSPKTDIRIASRKKILAAIEDCITQTNCQWTHRLKYEQTEVICADSMQKRLAKAIAAQGYPVHHLFSGAGHDGLAMASLCDIGMLFVRCKDGLSHHPDESITAEDAETAAQVLKTFLLTYGQE